MVGLRERKKARTRATIQHHALRLFRKQGYDATTVEQIAEAAEISPSTFFRYFPTKEDVVLLDDYDPLLIAAFEAQPPELSPLRALRNGMREALGTLSPAEWADARERTVLMLTVPQVRAAFLDNLAQTMNQIAEVVAKRVGRNPEDFAVRTLAGGVMGVFISLMFTWAEDLQADPRATIDEAMALLEAGLPV